MFKSVTILKLNYNSDEYIRSIKRIRQASCITDSNGCVIATRECYGLKEAKECVDDLIRGKQRTIFINPTEIKELVLHGFVIKDAENYHKYKTIEYNSELNRKLVGILNKQCV